MEKIKIENLSFTYPGGNTPVLKEINLEIKSGDFVTVFGKSGCGKTTLLKCLKPEITPGGTIDGSVAFYPSLQDTSCDIGFVMQNPENQVVCDKVWHELAFGLENLGLSENEIHSKVAEIVSFFGITDWFYKDTAYLSGGQKQLLSLASVMVMQPKVLVLDEPTSQLDPIAADEFLRTLKKINQELGITVILSEHRLEEAVSLSDKLLALDDGKVLFYGLPKEAAVVFKNHDLIYSLPTPMRVFGAVEKEGDCPISVKEGRVWLSGLNKKGILVCENKKNIDTETVIKADKVWFRYEKNGADILKDFSVEIKRGEIYSLLGGNGAGKTTAIKVTAGLLKAYSGKIICKGKVVSLPQNPKMAFTEKTLEEDLKKVAKNIDEVSEICNITHLLDRHPYDLSGGELQRGALAKALLAKPDILFLDEPTKGMDGYFKENFVKLLFKLKESGITIFMVSHDVEFCARVSDRCGLFFDGGITSEESPCKFFSGKNFYTTAASRMSRGIIENAVTPEKIIEFLGGDVPQVAEKVHIQPIFCKAEEKPEKKRFPKGAVISGVIFAACMILQYVFSSAAKYFEYAMIGSFVLMFLFLTSNKKVHTQETQRGRKLSKRTVLAGVCGLLLIPLTILAGIYLLEDKHYYLISMLVIAETLVPFIFFFEKSKPGARELVTIAVLCAFAVAGRTVFFMVQEFKPVLAIVIISAMAFGGETGFLVGSTAAFVSNMFFGQGAWTPWQMFAYGIVGFIAGVLAKRGNLRRNRLLLCVFGFVCAVGIYGVIMNIGSVLMWQRYPTWEMIASSLLMGLSFDFIHGVATVFFLWFMAEPLLEKLDRIKTKYGIKK